MVIVVNDNSELLTPRDLRRDFTAQLERLDRGEVEKLVLMQGTDMKYVVLPVRKYEQLTKGG
jgi:hypothetical protein